MAKVMVVDDEVTMVQMVTESLRADGHEVMPFTNGTTAYEAIDSFTPELVVCGARAQRHEPADWWRVAVRTETAL